MRPHPTNPGSDPVVSRQDLDEVESRVPTEYFGMLEYPNLDEAVAKENWATVTKTPVRWGCVQAIQAALVRCSRDLEWRAAIAEEVSKLADQQAESKLSTVSSEQAMVDPQMNVMDRVLSMICMRYVHPANFRADKATVARLQLQELKRLRNEWVAELGGLPGAPR